eukprot:6520499-Pyramimonas_sp.AAC.2
MAQYPLPAGDSDSYYLVFRHTGASLEANHDVPLRMVSTNHFDQRHGMVYRVHQALRQGTTREIWNGHALVTGRGRPVTCFILQTDKEETAVGVVAFANFYLGTNDIRGLGVAMSDAMSMRNLDKHAEQSQTLRFVRAETVPPEQ